MKIEYARNPLASTVKLDERERVLFWHKVKLQELEDALFSMKWYLTEGNNFDPAKALQSYPGDVLTDEWVDGLVEHYLNELQGQHCGDCISVASSCSKCHAEEILGIDTIGPLGKHPSHYLASAFMYRDDNQWKHRSPEEALEWLRTYEPHAKWEGWEAYADKWKEEANKAYEYLLAYNKQHFGE